MRTTIPKKADAVLSADWHVRPDTPACRTDNYQATQEQKIEFIVNLARQHSCPIFVAGDLGNKARWPHWLETWLIRKLKGVHVVAVPGQHDLPQHRLDAFYNSGMGVVSNAGNLTPLLTQSKDPDKLSYMTFYKTAVFGFPFGVKLKCSEKAKTVNRSDGRTIGLAHMMVIKEKKLWPGQEAPKAKALLHKYKCFDTIVTGDNHNPFVVKYEGRLLVNPGSLMRMTAAQVDHKPRVYLWYADDNSVEPVYLPIEKDVVDRSHIEVREERDERMTTFVDRLRHDYEVGFSFRRNIEEFLKKNKVRPIVEEKIKEAMG